MRQLKKTAFKTQNESLLKNTAKLEGRSTSQYQHFADRFEQNEKKKDKILTYPVFRLSAGTLCIAKEFESQWLLKKY